MEQRMMAEAAMAKIERLTRQRDEFREQAEHQMTRALTLLDEIGRLKLWIRRIDNINDDPMRFSKAIDQACIDALAGKPMTGLITVTLQVHGPRAG